MASFARGKVVAVGERADRVVRARVALDDGREIETAGDPKMLGPLAEGDRVVVNVTGIDLRLGTGGVGFLLWNLDGEGPPGPGAGHIVKMRYTPWQTEVLAAEAQESPHHEALKEIRSIGGMPVVACGLHSQIAAAAAGIKARRPDTKVGYLMTDGAALPLAWSRLVKILRSSGSIDATCTSGHAFGGEFEAVNVFSGLAALRHVARVDVAIVAMGPGVVGTGTVLGFTAIEQGQVLDAAFGLDGIGIAALRLSFHDERIRHKGVSHHTVTALTIAARERCTVAVPVLPDDQGELVAEQLEEAGVAERHDIVLADGDAGLRWLRDRGIEPDSMGRSMSDAPEPFLAAAAAGAVAAGSLET